MSKKHLKSALSCAVASSALITALGAFTPAMAQIEEIVVTSQRREQSIQSIPISVTAFDSSALEALQIEDFSDLQFNTPNVNFTRGNFGGGNFQIRGIGSASIADSGDGGVGMHINEVPIRGGHLFDNEYYDIERIEVMRGPQGTLFGRNATGGAVNMITKKPTIGEFSGNLGTTFANFDSVKLNGALNIPLGDRVAVRLAGTKVERGGFTENLFTGNAIDGRDQYSWRASAQFEASDRLTFNAMYQYYEESSSRQRGSKQLCHRDPSALYGCLPDKLAFENVNSQSNWPNLFASSLIVGPLLAIQGGAYDPSVDAFDTGPFGNPQDLRKVALDFDPTYDAEETFYTYGFDYDFDQVSMHYVGSHRDSTNSSFSDYNQAVAGNASVNPVAYALFPITANTFFPGGQWATSAVTETGTGIVGGHVESLTDQPHSFDWNRGSSEGMTHELRFQSDLAGDFNWLFGAFYMETKSESDYYVNSSAFDYLSMLMGPIWLQGAFAGIEADSPGFLAFNGLDISSLSVFDGVGMVAPMFNAENRNNTLESWALFGEGYWQVRDDFKLTVGLRYTNDKKSIENRSTGFDAAGIAGECFTCVQPVDPSVLTNPGITPELAMAQALGLLGGFDQPVAEPWVKSEDSWNAMTGRVAFDWTPELDFTDATLIYGSISRGYKGGGFNPAVSSELGNVTQTFDPEFVLSYELGIKNDFADNRIRWNLTGFYYDYEGLQVAKITNRSAANENVDASIFGIESEFQYAPTESFIFNLNLSYLKTEIDDFQSIDPRDITAGRSDVTLLKDPTSGAQCIINHNGGPDPLTTELAPGFTILNAIAQAQSGILGYPLDPIANPQFMLCNEDLMNAIFAGVPGAASYTVSAGIEQDLSGNGLQNSPEFSLSAGGQYTHYFQNGMQLVSRVDYFWQDDMWGRVYNRNPIDRIGSWSQINASATLISEDDSWQLKAFIQNVLDDDNVTGMYVTDPAAGLFTNVMILEPRLYGLTLDVRF